jgi:hypothetical protein
MDPKDSEPMALVWIEIMDKSEIPWQHYTDLYLKAMAVRMQAQRDGEQMPHFSAELMAGCWPELREEIRQREIENGRTLTGHAETQCPLCFGTGKEYRFENGQPVGVTGKTCDHNGPVDTPYLLEGKPATFDDFQAVQERNLRAVQKQEREALPTAINILDDAATHIHRLADESMDSEEKAYLVEIWMKLLRAQKHVRESECASVAVGT